MLKRGCLVAVWMVAVLPNCVATTDGRTLPERWWQFARDPEVRDLIFNEDIPPELRKKSPATWDTHLHRSPEGEVAIWYSGDFGFVSFGTDSLLNLSKSPNRGWNFNAFPYFHEGQFHLVGGYGFWRGHADDVVFLETRGEWERVGHSEGLPTLEHPASHFSFRLASGEIGRLDWTVTAEYPDCTGLIWMAPAGGGTWSPSWEIPPLTGAASVIRTYDLADHLLLCMHNGGVIVVEKARMRCKVVLHSADWMRFRERQRDVDCTVHFTDRVEFWAGTNLLATLDVDALLGQIPNTPWQTFATPTDPATWTATAVPESPWSTWLVAALGIPVFFAGLALGMRGRRKRKAGIDTMELDLTDLELSPAMAALLAFPKRTITIAEFDALITGSREEGPEAIRSRRARLFKELNDEAVALFGYALLDRRRDPQDSRSYVYEVRSLPRWVRRDPHA